MTRRYKAVFGASAIARLYVVAFVMLYSGCTTNSLAVNTGQVAIGDLTIDVGSGWSRVVNRRATTVQHNIETWTRNGRLLDHVVVVTGVTNGQNVFANPYRSALVPVFRSDMSTDELGELVKSIITTSFGRERLHASSDNSRPHNFGVYPGTVFDVSVTPEDRPEYRGTAGVFVAEEKLYLMYFLGAVPYYHDKHRQEAVAMIVSATL